MQRSFKGVFRIPVTCCEEIHFITYNRKTGRLGLENHPTNTPLQREIQETLKSLPNDERPYCWRAMEAWKYLTDRYYYRHRWSNDIKNTVIPTQLIKFTERARQVGSTRLNLKDEGKPDPYRVTVKYRISSTLLPFFYRELVKCNYSLQQPVGLSSVQGHKTLVGGQDSWATCWAMYSKSKPGMTICANLDLNWFKLYRQGLHILETPDQGNLVVLERFQLGPMHDNELILRVVGKNSALCVETRRYRANQLVTIS